MVYKDVFFLTIKFSLSYLFYFDLDRLLSVIKYSTYTLSIIKYSQIFPNIDLGISFL